MNIIGKMYKYFNIKKEDIMISLRLLATQYGYDESTVRQWKANGMPMGKGTEEADTRAWIVQNVILPLRNTDTREQIDQERLRKLKAEAALSESPRII
jgi:phage terminase Nu1 subunit (DNA packaging protein)